MITPELASVIDGAIKSAFAGLHVALPGSVQKYDSVNRLADVELQIKNTLPTAAKDGTTADEILPVLVNVPVQFMIAGDFFVLLPIEAGTTGMVIFCDLSIDQWIALGKLSAPGYTKRHGLSGAVFIPGILPKTSPLLVTMPAGQMALGKALGAQLRLNGSTVDATTAGASAATDFVAMSIKTDLIKSTIAATATGQVCAAPDAPCPFATALATALNLLSTTASTNLKAD